MTDSSHGKHQLHPTEYLNRNFYFTTSGAFRTQTLIDTIGEIGVDRVLFSVDYPYESMKEGADWFDNSSISEADKLKIDVQTLKRYLKSNPEQPCQMTWLFAIRLMAFETVRSSS